MKRFINTIILLVCFVSFAETGAAQERFIYKGGGKRDPFVPLIGVKTGIVRRDAEGIEGIASVGDVKLQGIAFDAKGNKVAIINGDMIKVGETVFRVTLKKIEGNMIVLSINGEDYRINLYEEKEGGMYRVE